MHILRVHEFKFWNNSSPPFSTLLIFVLESLITSREQKIGGLTICMHVEGMFLAAAKRDNDFLVTGILGQTRKCATLCMCGNGGGGGASENVSFLVAQI